MKVIFCPHLLPIDRSDHLHLEPENDQDQRTLEKLLKRGLHLGAGRCPTTGKILHLAIATPSPVPA